MDKKVYGVGIVDVDYIVRKYKEMPKVNNKRVRKMVFQCPYYFKWKCMLWRLSLSDCYKDCSLHPEWVYLSKFKSWVLEKEAHFGEVLKLNLDKDLLVRGNKVYGPDTCMFIPTEVNNCLIARKVNTDLPRGVHICCKTAKFIAHCHFNGKQNHVGTFSNPEEAHKAWQLAKINQLKEVASRQHQRRDIQDALLNRAYLLQCEHDNNVESLSV